MKELTNIRDALFRLAAGLEEEKRGSAAIVASLLGNRVNAVMERVRNGTAPKG